MFNIKFRLKILRLFFQDSSFKRVFLKHMRKDFFEANYEIILIKYLKHFGQGFMQYDTFKSRMALSKKGKADLEVLQQYETIIKPNEIVVDKEAVQEVMEKFIIDSSLKRELENIYNKLDTFGEIDMEGVQERLKKAINIIPKSEYDTYDYYDNIDARTDNYQKEDNIFNILVPLTLKDSHKHCIQKNEFVVIGAAPSRGKTAIMLNLLQKANVCMLNCLYITFEVRTQKVAQRLDSTFTLIDSTEMHNKSDEVRELLHYFKKSFGSKIKIAQFPSRSKTVQEIKEYIDDLRMSMHFEPDIIFIDYADLVKEMPSHYKLPRHEKLGYIYSDLYKMQQELGITVVTASQTNKSTTEKVIVGMEDLADSPLQKMAAVDKVILCSQTPTMFANKQFIMHTDKDRNGAGRGTAYLYKHDWDKQKIKLIKELNFQDIEEMEKEEKNRKKNAGLKDK